MIVFTVVTTPRPQRVAYSRRRADRLGKGLPNLYVDTELEQQPGQVRDEVMDDCGEIPRSKSSIRVGEVVQRHWQRIVGSGTVLAADLVLSFLAAGSRHAALRFKWLTCRKILQIK